MNEFQEILLVEIDEIKKPTSSTLITNFTFDSSSSDLFEIMKLYKDVPQSKSPVKVQGFSLKEEDFPISNEEIKQKAIQIVVRSLKEGKSKFFHMVKLLVDYNSEFVDEDKQLSETFKTLFLNELLVLKRDLLTFGTAKNILEKAQVILKEQTFLTISAYENHLKENLSDIKNQLEWMCHETLSDYLKNYFKWNELDLKTHLEKDSALFVARLNVFFPHSISMQNHYYAIKELREIEHIKKKINSDILLFEESEQKVLHLIEQKSGKLREAENQLMEKKRKHRENLIETVVQVQKGIKKAGVPYEYRNELGIESLRRMAGSVDLNAVDEETGSNLALLAIQYDNLDIYSYLVKQKADVMAENRKGLYALMYERALYSFGNITTDSQSLIYSVDAADDLLRKMESFLYNYLDSWECRKKEHDELVNSNSFLMSIQKEFLKLAEQLFHVRSHFQKRQEEANLYLKKVESALKEIPVNFYREIFQIFSKSNRGTLNGSTLHAGIKEFLEVIEQHGAYKYLVNPSELLAKQNKDLKRDNNNLADEVKQLKIDMKAIKDRNVDQDLKIELSKQKIEYDQKLKDQKEEFTQKLEKMARSLEELQRRYDEEKPREETKGNAESDAEDSESSPKFNR